MLILQFFKGIVFFACFGVIALFPVYVAVGIYRFFRARGMGVKNLFNAGVFVLYLFMLPFSLFLLLAFISTGQERPRQAEAKQNLGAIFVCQTAYFGEYGTFAGGAYAFDKIAWSPEGRNRYSYYCGDEVIPNRKGPAIKFDPHSDLGAGPLSDSTNFTCLTVANLDHDLSLEIWTINDAKNLVRISNDADNTFTIPPGWKTPPRSPLFHQVESSVLDLADELPHLKWLLSLVYMALVVLLFKLAQKQSRQFKESVKQHLEQQQP